VINLVLRRSIREFPGRPRGYASDGQEKPALERGRARTRWPVTEQIALATAGRTGGRAARRGPPPRSTTDGRGRRNEEKSTVRDKTRATRALGSIGGDDEADPC
jgi:hypothetical protein